MVANQTVAGLPAQKQLFVECITDRGLSYEEATKVAGYSSGYQYTLSSDPQIAAAIQERMWWLLRTQDAPAARRVLRSIMLDETASKAARIECAKALLNRGGFVEPKALPITGDALAKPPSEMTGEELQQAIAQLQSEAGKRLEGAKVIDGACEPLPGAAAVQMLDMLE